MCCPLFFSIFLIVIVLGGNGCLASLTSSVTSDFGGGDDEVTAAAVGIVLDSLDDIHCLLEARYSFVILSSLLQLKILLRRYSPVILICRHFRGDCDFLVPVLCDLQLHQLLDLYDRIAVGFKSFARQLPPRMNAMTKLREALAVLKVTDTNVLVQKGRRP
jgi:hypothetical protein